MSRFGERDRVAIVMERGLRAGIEGKWHSGLRGNEYKIECAMAEHFGERAEAGADGQAVGSLVPGDGDARELAACVGVGKAVVFVEGEVRVAAGVDEQGNGVASFFGGVLEIGAEGDDGAGGDEEGHGVEGSGDGNVVAGGKELAGPEMIPAI